jgi:hypothetical protein
MNKVSSGGINAESNAVRRCACSFDGKQAGKEDQQRNDDRMERSKCWSNSISEFRLPGFRIPGDGNVKDPSQESQSCEIQNPEIPKEAHQQRISHTGRKLHFGVSDTGKLRSQELRLFNTGVPELRNPESRNPERGT